MTDTEKLAKVMMSLQWDANGTSEQTGRAVTALAKHLEKCAEELYAGVKAEDWISVYDALSYTLSDMRLTFQYVTEARDAKRIYCTAKHVIDR